MADYIDVSGADDYGTSFVHSVITQESNDEYAQYWFNEYFFNPDLSDSQREEIYREMVDYMWDEYGIDFEQAFDWEDFREWYDSQ
jgi:hypothetical protein